jgi:MFS family permease
MSTVVSVLVSDIVPLRKRGTWQGYLNLVSVAGASAGGPLGGLLADSIGWRWYPSPLPHPSNTNEHQGISRPRSPLSLGDCDRIFHPRRPTTLCQPLAL